MKNGKELPDNLPERVGDVTNKNICLPKYLSYLSISLDAMERKPA